MSVLPGVNGLVWGSLSPATNRNKIDCGYLPNPPCFILLQGRFYVARHKKDVRLLSSDEFFTVYLRQLQVKKSVSELRTITYSCNRFVWDCIMSLGIWILDLWLFSTIDGHLLLWEAEIVVVMFQEYFEFLFLWTKICVSLLLLIYLNLF